MRVPLAVSQQSGLAVKMLGAHLADEGDVSVGLYVAVIGAGLAEGLATHLAFVGSFTSVCV